MANAGLIVVSGLPGVGKTSIARALAGRVGTVHLRLDTIEQILLSSQLPDDMADAGYCICYALAEDNLWIGRVVIGDSVNALPVTRAAWRALAKRTDARLFEIEVICTDTAEHRRRVETRASDMPDHKPPTWEQVQSRQYEPWSEVDLIIDTATNTVAESVSIIVDGLEKAHLVRT
jgi:predicted kinase